MKKNWVLLAMVAFAACQHSGKSGSSGDSTTINTKTSSPADGGPNNGLGDTTTYNRSNDTVTHDTTQKHP